MTMRDYLTCHQLSGPMAARERRNLRSSSTFIPIARTSSFGIAVSAARECTSRSANRAASVRKQRRVSELDARGHSRAGRSHSQARPQTKLLRHSHRPRLTPRSHSSTAVAAGRVELAARHSTPTRVRSDPGQRCAVMKSVLLRTLDGLVLRVQRVSAGGCTVPENGSARHTVYHPPQDRVSASKPQPAQKI